jgi:hypothetical protein
VPDKPIQEQFGQQVIDAFAQFARSDLRAPDELEAHEFSHVSDATLRRRLAEVFYGVRWIYKLGLALLTKDAERAAHVRAQIVDYASVSEGLLADCLVHAIRNGYTTGTGYTFDDPNRKLRMQRNTVHLQERSAVGRTAFLNQSKRAFDAVTRTIRQTKKWKTTYP